MHTLEQLAQAVVDGDGAAWAKLQLETVPRIEAILRAHKSMRSRGLHLLVDDVQEVMTTTLERLSRNQFHNLRRYVEQLQRLEAAAQSFDSWLFGCVDYTIREHLRRRYGRAPKVRPGAEEMARPSKRDANTYAGELSEAPGRQPLAHTLGITMNLTAAQILAYAQEKFTPDEAAAFRMHYLEDRDFEEIALRLGIDGVRDAEKLIRRLNARLRYRFGPDQPDAAP